LDLKKLMYHFFAYFQKRTDSNQFIPVVQSHRGYCQNTQDIRENTLAAICKSLELCYEMVEFDVRLTKDQHVVLFHDEVVHGCKISNMSLKDLRSKVAVDTLSEVFDWYQNKYLPKAFAKNHIQIQNFKLNIEIKSKVINGHLEKSVFELIKKFNMRDYILISSFNPVSLFYFKQMDAKIFRSLLLSDEKNYGNNFFIRNMTLNFLSKPNALHLRDQDWNPDLYKALIYKKIPIILWTCNDLTRVQAYLKQGVAGVISDQIKPADLQSDHY
jgi:glycerophosphoryl diester phosphodiesterase